jgi:hypothetical protein
MGVIGLIIEKGEKGNILFPAFKFKKEFSKLKKLGNGQLLEL